MRKKQHIKSAADNSDSQKKLDIIIELLLDMRDMIQKQNEMIRRSQGNKNG